MNALLWFLLGVVLTISGQALAEEIWGYDSQGNYYSGTYDSRTGDYSILGNTGYSAGKGPVLDPTPRHRSPC